MNPFISFYNRFYNDVCRFGIFEILSEKIVFMRVIKFLLPFAFFVKGGFVFAQSSQEIIKINQSGYYPAAPKIAIVASDYSNDEYAGSNFGFYILKFNSTDTVYKNSL